MTFERVAIYATMGLAVTAFLAGIVVATGAGMALKALR